MEIPNAACVRGRKVGTGNTHRALPAGKRFGTYQMIVARLFRHDCVVCSEHSRGREEDRGRRVTTNAEVTQQRRGSVVQGNAAEREESVGLEARPGAGSGIFKEGLPNDQIFSAVEACLFCSKVATLLHWPLSLCDKSKRGVCLAKKSTVYSPHFRTAHEFFLQPTRSPLSRRSRSVL
jgi:hypothetical protein